MDFTEKPDYARVVDICTKDSLRELATPGLLAIFAPITIGFAFGAGPLAGYLAGAIAAGVLMAVFLANSGGAWDNAKKMVEDGSYGGKGSEPHAATVIGDTVGDPFKDTAGPAINPLIKVMNLVAVLIAPAVIEFSTGTDKNNGVRAAIAIIAFADHRGRGHRLEAPQGVDGRRRAGLPSRSPRPPPESERPRPTGGPGMVPGPPVVVCHDDCSSRPSRRRLRVGAVGRCGPEGASVSAVLAVRRGCRDAVPGRPRRRAARRRALGPLSRHGPALGRRRRPLARRRARRRVRRTRSSTDPTPSFRPRAAGASAPRSPPRWRTQATRWSRGANEGAPAASCSPPAACGSGRSRRAAPDEAGFLLGTHRADPGLHLAAGAQLSRLGAGGGVDRRARRPGLAYHLGQAAAALGRAGRRTTGRRRPVLVLSTPAVGAVSPGTPVTRARCDRPVPSATGGCSPTTKHCKGSRRRGWQVGEDGHQAGDRRVV